MKSRINAQLHPWSTPCCQRALSKDAALTNRKQDRASGPDTGKSNISSSKQSDLSAVVRGTARSDDLVVTNKQRRVCLETRRLDERLADPKRCLGAIQGTAPQYPRTCFLSGEAVSRMLCAFVVLGPRELFPVLTGQPSTGSAPSSLLLSLFR